MQQCSCPPPHPRLRSHVARRISGPVIDVLDVSYAGDGIGMTDVAWDLAVDGEKVGVMRTASDGAWHLVLPGSWQTFATKADLLAAAPYLKRAPLTLPRARRRSR